MYQFEELTEETRCAMFREFLAEENGGNPYRSPILSEQGQSVYPDVMPEAISNGNEESLGLHLSNPEYWCPHTTQHRSGKSVKMRVNYEAAAKRLAVTEFNTWYVRGLSCILLNEGVEACEVYRTEAAKEPRGECTNHEGQQFSVQEIYDGHRARYWPPPGDPNALSIPVGPYCHHSIRRI